MVWQKQKATFFLPAKQVALTPGQQAGKEGPVLGCQEHPSTPLWADQVKLANHGFLEVETQSGPNLVWHGAEETAFYLSLGKKKEPRG